jgi:outer membrane autotransporter protein
MRASALAAATLAAATLAAAPWAVGQTTTPPAGNLANLPGLTELQQPGAAYVQRVCGGLAANGTQPPVTSGPAGSGPERLFYSCRVLVQSANDLADSGATAFSNGNTNPQLRTAVQATEAVQMNAQKQKSSEAARQSLLAARLLDLRSGSRGFVAGVSQPDATVAGADTPSLRGARGGGASADDSARWGGFINAGYTWGDVDTTSFQDGYSYDNYNVLAGVDYRVNDALVFGAAVNYGDTHSDYDQSLGNVKARTWGVAAYGSYYRDNWYVDGVVGYGSVDYDTRRNIIIPSSTGIQPFNTTATASPNGDQWSAAIGGGVNLDYQGFVVTPSARLSYIRVTNKSFDESEPINGMGLHVDERTLTSLQSALGAKIATTVSTAYGVFGPYFQAQWMHEFRNGSTSIVSKFVNFPTGDPIFIPTEDPTRDYAVVMAGSSVTLPNNLSGFAQFGAALGLKHETSYGVIVGVRKQF